MAAATPAVHLCALHDELVVGAGACRVRKNVPKRRPAVAAVVFGSRRKQRQVATCARVDTGTGLFDERTRKRRLGGVLAKNLVAIFAGDTTPIGVGVRYFVCR